MPPTLTPEAIRKMVSYYYLLAYGPPQYFEDNQRASRAMRTRLAEANSLSLEEFREAAAAESAFRMAAFQGATRSPEKSMVEMLRRVLLRADGNQEEQANFLKVMLAVTAHPGRAKENNRLHRQKGCAFCTMPCRYGFFTLMVEPDFKTLLGMLDAENQKLAAERDPVLVLWSYTTRQIWNLLEAKNGVISPIHLGNLSYCLLLLGTAKSRFALPEKELQAYQRLSQAKIQELGAAPIRLEEP